MECEPLGIKTYEDLWSVVRPISLCSTLALLLSVPGIGIAQQLLPQTRIRLSVVQWVPTKGIYEPWGAISGEYTVSDVGTVSVPVLGTIGVGSHDDAGLAADIAERLRTKLGLVAAPEAAVEIVSYPPVYVVGDVEKPGEYQYRTGLTVLQAFATSGGELRSENEAKSSLEITRLLGEIKASDGLILRSTARSARLEAEMSGATELHFSQSIDGTNPLSTAIFDQEKIIFDSRKRAMEQQARSLTDLRDFLQKEIGSLEEKLANVEANIKSSETELATAAQLVGRGIATASRQMDAERDLRTDQGQRLDLETAIMRAKQEFSRASRDLQSLQDDRRTQAAVELQTERASIDQEQLKRETNQKVLVEALSANPSMARSEETSIVTFRVLRRENGKLNDIAASDTTILMPGDVVKVAKKPMVSGQGQTSQSDIAKDKLTSTQSSHSVQAGQ